MALVMPVSGEVKPRRSSFRGERRPWMLKDYLRDDMSSCSSNGFRTFPRRQCCAAVRNMIENKIIRNCSKPPKGISCSRSVSSVLQRASMAVVNAVKLLPFKSLVANAADGRRILPRSFSKKIFKRSSWMMKRYSSGERKAVVKKDQECGCDEIEQWISSGVVGAEKYQPSDLSNDTTVTNSATTTTTNSNSNSDGKSDSWSDITFTSDYCLTCSSENDAVDRREKTPAKDDEELEEEEVSRSVGVTAVKSGWHNNEAVKKEQLSPISTLDFPESDEGSLSPFTLRITRLKGTQERLMKKLRKFESLVALGLEPLNLGNLVSCTQVKDRSPQFSIQSCSTPSYVVSSGSEEEEHCQENEAMKKARQLLNFIKEKKPIKATYTFDPNLMLLDFFQENAFDKEDDVLLKEAKDWLHGHCDKLILHSNEMKDKGETYIPDMDGQGRRPRDAKPQKEEVGVELGDEVLAYLIEELLQECCS